MTLSFGHQYGLLLLVLPCLFCYQTAQALESFQQQQILLPLLPDVRAAAAAANARPQHQQQRRFQDVTLLVSLEQSLEGKPNHHHQQQQLQQEQDSSLAVLQSVSKEYHATNNTTRAAEAAAAAGKAAAAAAVANSKPGLATHRPWVIAHRGASGLLPEHTLPAYKLAIDQGADFIECDVILTRDLVPICRHEADLNLTTDAAVKFPHRVNTYTIDGKTHTGVFAADLTLAEVKTLRAKQRWEFRDHSQDVLHPVATLSEFLDLVAAAPRAVGIYPEVKHPSWHASLPWVAAANTTVQKILLDTLVTRGYSGAFISPKWLAAPVFIQSFEETSLKELAAVTDLPLVLLLGGWPGFTAPDTGLTHEQMVSEEHLAYLATFVSGLGPWKDTLYVSSLEGASSTEAGGYSIKGIAKGSSSSRRRHKHRSGSSSSLGGDEEQQQQQQWEDVQGLRSTGLAARLLSTGLQVHPYTLRDEARFVPPGVQEGVIGEFQQMFQVEGVTGAFADYPGTLRNWFDQNYQQQ